MKTLLGLFLASVALHAQFMPGLGGGGCGNGASCSTTPTPPTFIDGQQTTGAATGTTAAITNTGSTALIVVSGCFSQSCDGGAPLTITSTPSNSFTCAALSSTGSGAVSSGSICYTLTPAAGATVTVSFSGCMAACWIAGITLSGSGALDGSIISSVTSSGTGILTFSPGSITTGFANDIVVSGIAGYCAASGTNAINLSYTLALSTCAVATMDGAIGYKIITAAGSTNPQWSVSNGGSGWAGIVGWNLALKGL